MSWAQALCQQFMTLKISVLGILAMMCLGFNLCLHRLFRGAPGGSVGYVLQSPTIPPGAKPGNLCFFLGHSQSSLFTLGMRWAGRFKPSWCLVKAGCWCSEKGSGQQWELGELLTFHCTSRPPEHFHWEGRRRSGIGGGSVLLISGRFFSGVSSGAGARF